MRWTAEQRDRYDARRDDTAAKIVVNSAELTKYGDASVADALKRVPGVTVISTGRGADIRLRGLGNGYTQILLDGERAPSGFSVDSLNPAQVERVEIIRSASAELSTESVAGTINIVRKKAVGTAQRQVQFGYGGTPGERTPRAVLLWADKADRLAYSLSANSRVTWNRRTSVIDDDTSNDAGQVSATQHTPSREDLRFSTLNVLPRLSWRRGDGDVLSSDSAVSFTSFDFHAQRRPAAPAPAAETLDLAIRTRSLSLKSDLGWSGQAASGLRYDLKAGVQAASGGNDSTRNLSSAGSASTDTQALRSRERGVNSSGKLSNTVAAAHLVTAGWEAWRLVRDETLTDKPGAGGDYRATVVRAAAFLQDEWTISARWALYLGARFERIAFASAGVDSGASIWSPIAQTLIKPPGLPNDQLRIALTRTFKMADVVNLLPRRRRYEINASTNPDLEGNPALRPELARGIDVGWEHRFNKSALISAGLSSRRIDDYTLTLVSLDNHGRWVGRPVNAGAARLLGLELEARFTLSLLAPRLPAIELRAGLTRNWSRVDQVPGPHNWIAQQVPLQATLVADYSAGAWSGGASLVLRRGGWANLTAAQSSFTNSRRDLDLYLVWKRSASDQLRLTLGNLLTAPDISASRYRTAPATATRTITAPGLLSVRALVEHKF